MSKDSWNISLGNGAGIKHEKAVAGLEKMLEWKNHYGNRWLILNEGLERGIYRETGRSGKKL